MSEQAQETEVGTLVRDEENLGRELPAPTTSRFDLAAVGDPTAGLQKAEELVQYMSSKCSGEEYIAQIQGKDFPRCEWWTSVGAGLGLFPQEESVERLDREGEIAYEAVVGVYDGEQRVTRGSAICSDSEPTWSGRDEYAIRSMAITRATSKAYRNGLSFLAVMANLEPTPAEEMQGSQGGAGQSQPDEPDLECPDCGGPVWDNTDDAKAAANGGKRPNFKCKDTDDCDWASWDSFEEVYGTDAQETDDETLDAIGEALNELQGWNQEKADEIGQWLSDNRDAVEGSQDRAEKVLERLENRIKEAKDEVEAATEQKEAL